MAKLFCHFSCVGCLWPFVWMLPPGEEEILLVGKMMPDKDNNISLVTGAKRKHGDTR